MKLAIAADHAGFEQKKILIAWIVEQGHELVDLGPYDAERVDYPDYAQKVGAYVADGQAQAGILICGTGIGMAIAANKIKGVRAANITSPEFAALAREHNDANVLTISARFTNSETNKAIINSFLTTDFAGGRHANRVAKISALE